MEKSFICGMILGLTVGAVIAANSNKARKLVKEGQSQLKNKISEITERKDKNSDDYEELND